MFGRRGGQTSPSCTESSRSNDCRIAIGQLHATVTYFAAEVSQVLLIANTKIKCIEFVAPDTKAFWEKHSAADTEFNVSGIKSHKIMLQMV